MRSVYLAHLGYNMWKEAPVDRIDGVKATDMPFVEQATASYDLRFDTDEWDKIVKLLIEAGCDTVLLDIGEGVVYERHPELAVNGSWSKQRLADEISRLKGLGLTVLPKLNFSACHDEWLGIYSRMVSTPEYYRVCADCIDELAELFSGADMFHLGMDEETAGHQSTYKYIVVRQCDLWWHDFDFLVKTVEKHGMRPWVWSDYGWHNADLFWKNMSKDIVQSNWYYGDFVENEKHYYGFYDDLASRGYDQIPTGSNWSFYENMPKTAQYVKSLPQDHMLGIMQSVWHPTIRKYDERHTGAIKALAEANRIIGK
ncbi:MAG: hypothetical protein K6D94_01425 [Clostridiales bacterium]|nr:hypothetical protein [Clostridiales bacterium]